MKANAYDILAEKVVSRKNDLENEMIQLLVQCFRSHADHTRADR